MKEENLDLLDLDDADTTAEDNLPDATPFVAPRPHRPWLLLGIGLAVIVLAVFIIIRVVGSNSSSSIDVDLGEPIVVTEREVPVEPAPEPVAVPVIPVPAPAPMPMPAVQPEPAPMPAPVVVHPEPKPVVQPEPAPAPQQNVRVVQDRRDVTFNPERKAPKAIPAPAPKTVKTPTKPKPAPKPAVQKVANGGWYVQFGSYGTRAAAEASEKKIRSGHPSLFSGKQFVILAAVLPNGQTTYRLRIAFATSNDANGFCRNAKSDGLDCYVAK